MTVYNNQTITYDALGNPTSYLGAALTWRGRELTSYTKGNKQISYNYDVDGMRYKKTVTTNGTVTDVYDYIYSDGKLIAISHTAGAVTNSARFIYDENGEVKGFIFNDTAVYMYLKNLQGDITALVDENGSIIVTYTYDAWGKVTFSSDNTTYAEILSSVSPFAYRSYCYDYDIKLYYLQSRYYDPQICRFINADSTDYLGASGGMVSYNLFAYCENDPVNCVDATGTWGYDVHAGYYKTKKLNLSDYKTISLKKFSKLSSSESYYVYSGVSCVYIPYYKYNFTNVYYGTYYWAVDTGINPTYAKKIADACNSVDNIFNGDAPFVPLKSNQSWHFNTNRGTRKKDSRMINYWEYTEKADFYIKRSIISVQNGITTYNTYMFDEKGQGTVPCPDKS